MLDGIKLHGVGIDAINLTKNPLLNFVTCVNLKTGEIQASETNNSVLIEDYITNTHVAKFKELTFTFKETTLINVITNAQRKSYNMDITGSLHKLYNNGKNDNDFTFTELADTIAYLIQTFGESIMNFKILRLEYGVNIDTPIPASELINQTIIYKTKRANVLNYNNGLMKCFRLTQYEVKIYDKGLQTNAGYNKLRFEIKILNSQYLKATKIRTLKDLLKIEVWNKLASHLYDVFINLLIYEDITNKLTEKEIIFYTNAQNINYWLKLKNKDTFRNNRAKFRKINKKYGCMLQDIVAKTIKEKCDFLLIN